MERHAFFGTREPFWGTKWAETAGRKVDSVQTESRTALKLLLVRLTLTFTSGRSRVSTESYLCKI